MSNRIRLSVLLVLYCLIFWDSSPDAVAPLFFAVPYFSVPAARIGIPQVAAWVGWISLVLTFLAFKERYPQRITLAAKIGLSVSVCLFIASSSQLIFPVTTAVPFCVVAPWPQRKKQAPNSADEPPARLPLHRDINEHENPTFP